MAYSIVGIANMALQKLGAKSSITSLTDGTPNATKVSVVWEYILNETLETIKPSFAKVRVALSQSSTTPANDDQYLYAYPFPSDYLALADGRADDVAIWPEDVAPYTVETLADGTLCLMTNYDSTTAGYSIYLTYIRKTTDPSKYSALFINALTFRLAAELAFSVTEGTGKFEAMTNLYAKARLKAIASDRTHRYLANEKANADWEGAGR
jgi:hypothetical protein